MKKSLPGKMIVCEECQFTYGKKLSDQMVREIVRLRLEGLSYGDILRHLKERRVRISKATIQRYVKRWENQ